MKHDLWTRNGESVWRSKIGMSQTDDSKPPKQRNVYLRRLKVLVEQRMLEFIYGQDNDPLAKKERAPTWTPIPWVCHNLEISHAHLSRLFRELLGYNVIQLYDKLKLEETLSVLKYIELIRAFVAAHFPAGAPYSGNGSKHFWKWLKEQRQNPDFDRQALAREFNFPSAARFHRAFFFATNATPREFENLIVRQSLNDPGALQKTIDSFTPTAAALKHRGMCPLRDVQDILPEFVTLDSEQVEELEIQPVEKPKDLEFPIVLYKPKPPADPEIIDAVFKIINRHAPPRLNAPPSDSQEPSDV